MGCGNSKVDNSARRPPPRRQQQGGNKKGIKTSQERQDDGENDKNNNETTKKPQSKSQSTRTRQSNQKTKNNTGYDDENDANEINQTRQSNQENNQNAGYDEENDISERKRTKVAVNEKGYKKRIRENLRNACAGTDIEHLEKCMEIFVNNKLEDGGDYSEAQDRLSFLLVRKEIKDACLRNHPVVLDKAIQRVEASPYKRNLQPYLNRAYYLKQHQNELDTFRHDISNMDQSTVSEVKSYNSPPEGVHETMIATYMILGYPEQHLVDWTEITALMNRIGKDSLLREIQNADQKNIDKNTALRARHYLGMHTLDEVRIVSNGAAAFYVWSSRMVGKHDVDKKSTTANSKQLTNSRGGGQNRSDNQSKPVTPANSVKNSKGQKQNTAKQQNSSKK